MNPEEERPTTPAPETVQPPKGAESLTPEEQMARFEEALKESDWGHQPC